MTPRSRPAVRSLLIAFSAIAAMLITSAPAHAAPSRAAKTKAADHRLTQNLADFTTVANKARTAQGTRATGGQGLDWSADGCSASDAVVLPAWKRFFRASCNRHDFGYRNHGRNLKHGLALRSTNAQKTKVDTRFLADMKWQCANRGKDLPSGKTILHCRVEAEKIYRGVSKSTAGSAGLWGNPQNAFFNSECTPGALCLFDDKNQKDRRITFGGKSGYPVDSTATSVKNLDSYGFGDKTSSVVNNSAYAWVLYDDDNFKDRQICVRAGRTIKDLKAAAFKFNDKTSSVKRLKSKTC